MENRAQDQAAAARNMHQEPMTGTGLFGGHSGTLGVFAAFEGIALLLILIFFFSLIGSGSIGLLVLLLFSCIFHVAVQVAIGYFDPGQVTASLDLLEKNELEEKDAACILDDLQKTPVLVYVNGEGYHTDMIHHGNDVTKMEEREVTDRQERKPFKYASWKHIAGSLSVLDTSPIIALELVPQIECADSETTKAKQELHKSVLEACKHCQLSRSSETVIMSHPRLTICNTLLLMTRSPGVQLPAWIQSSYYKIPRYICPGWGSIFRILFLQRVTNARLHLKKMISVRKQTGNDWCDLEEGAYEYYEKSSKQTANPPRASEAAKIEEPLKPQTPRGLGIFGWNSGSGATEATRFGNVESSLGANGTSGNTTGTPVSF